MKLVSYEVYTPVGVFERIGSISQDRIIDLNMGYITLLERKKGMARPYQLASVIVPPNMIQFFEGGEPSLQAAKEVVDYIEAELAEEEVLGPRQEKVVYGTDEVKLLAPVPRPNSIRDCNCYLLHMERALRALGKPFDGTIPKFPPYAKGNPQTVIGPEEPVLWPRYTEKLDFELELGLYIGKRGKNISQDIVYEYLAGFTIFNDVSARDRQREERSVYGKAKDFDHSNIMGPCLVTPDELDPGNVKMTARVNGEVWAEGTTADMYVSFAELIEFLSESETLYPGDFIASGTVPSGCGLELDRWIKPGDVIELGAEGIGVLRNRVVQEPSR